MRILCVETEPGAAAGIASRLRIGGHDVVGCFDACTDPAGPCTGLERPGSCPLDDPAGVDVVLDVRAGDHPRPTASEVGITCALRQNVPFAVTGQRGPNPFARWTAAVADADHVAAGCQAAVQHRLDELATQVSIAVCRWLDRGYVPGIDIRTEAHRRHRDLTVVIHRPAAATSLMATGSCRVIGDRRPRTL